MNDVRFIQMAQSILVPISKKGNGKNSDIIQQLELAVSEMIGMVSPLGIIPSKLFNVCIH